MPEQLPPESPIRASLDKFAKQEAEKHNTIDFEATKAGGGVPAEATVTLGTSGSSKWFDWGVGAWVRRKCQPGGTSVGVKGEIKF
jgi:hypothetical protein